MTALSSATLHILSNFALAVNAVTDVQGDRNSKNEVFVQQVAEANVQLNVQAMTDRSSVLRDLVRRGKLKIVGATYDVASGRVTLSLWPRLGGVDRSVVIGR